MTPDEVAAAMPVSAGTQARWKEMVVRWMREALPSVAASISGTVATLTAVANIQSDEFTTGVTGFTGFYTSTLATVTLSTPTGRLSIGYGGSLNGGDGYFCYSVVGATSGVIVDRAVVQANPARRVAVTGGASFAPSGWKTVIQTVPAGETLTVKLEIYADTTATYFFGGSINANPSL